MDAAELADMLETLTKGHAELQRWNVVRLDTRSPEGTLLHYEDFDNVGHPCLAESASFDLENSSVRPTRTFSGKNRPILHRKELLVRSDDPHYTTYARLTREEERVGLLRNSTRIGWSSQWSKILDDHGVRVENHEVIVESAGEFT